MTSLGDFVTRRRGWVLGAWLALAAGLWLLVPPVDPAATELTEYLPHNSPSQRVLREMGRLFPEDSGQGEAVIVFERKGGSLTRADLDAIEEAAARMPRPLPSDKPDTNLAGLHVRSPRSIPLPHNPLISEPGPDGQAALVVVQVPADFISIRSARVVTHIRGVLAGGTLPEGLSAAVTGSSGYGCDYGEAVEESNKRTSLATLTAVLLILIVVYRAPLAAMIPLAAVSLAAVVVIQLRTIFSHFGLHSGTAESVFVFVLLYGAGTDYSLLLISRYREYVLGGMAPRRAVAAALNSTMPAILASGITNSLGLLTLCTAKFKIFQTTGPAVAEALGLMMLAALTLVPALLSFFSGAIFWPRRRASAYALPAPHPSHEASDHIPPVPAAGQLRKGSRLWRRIAILVTGRPVTVLVLCAAVFCAPAIVGGRVDRVYDQLTTLSTKYQAVRGMQMVKRHWSVGELGPAQLLVTAPAPLKLDQWRDLSAKLTGAALLMTGVQDVRSVSQPMGKAYAAAPGPDANSKSNPALPGLLSLPSTLLSGLGELIVGPAIQQASAKEYVSADGRAMRASVVLRSAALTPEAMNAVDEVRAKAAQIVRSAVPGADLMIGGTTAYMEDERAVTSADFHRIAVLTVGVIIVILLVLIRKPAVALFMAACSVLAYVTTLGLSYWVFTGLLHADGLDWKVQIFLFVVMVAVGVDYSIFLGARLVQESRRPNAPPLGSTAISPPIGGPAPAPAALALRLIAIRRAVVHTGPVISSCGVIMAATLGSLMMGDLALLHQLGFAMALGMLLDTFVVRPLLLPSFVAAIARLRNKATGKRQQATGQPDSPSV